MGVKSIIFFMVDKFVIGNRRTKHVHPDLMGTKGGVLFYIIDGFVVIGPDCAPCAVFNTVFQEGAGLQILETYGVFSAAQSVFSKGKKAIVSTW